MSTNVKKIVLIVLCIAAGSGGAYYYQNSCCKKECTRSVETIAGDCSENGCSNNVSLEETPEVGIIEEIKDAIMNVTDSGIKYTITTPAPEGAQSPKVGKDVVVHYTGWLYEDGQKGTKFDSSVDRGEPFKFKVGVGYVIAGWDESVLDMKKGEKREVIIPSDLAYGVRGAGRVIPSNATLLFEIELLDFA